MNLIPALTLFFALYAVFGMGYSLHLGRNDIVDVMWGPGIAGLGWLAWSISSSGGLAWLVPLIMTVWALRLSGHIALRMSEQEDPRYRAWRDQWMQKGKGYFLVRSFFQVFVLQGLLMIVVAMPAILAMYFGWGEKIMWWQIIGMLVWAEGFTIETLADWQLSDFIQRKRAGLEPTKYMTRGVWAWSRHPNYFGEVEQWWGIFLIALTAGVPWTWLGIISPIAITLLILKVSGIPMLERQFAQDPEYQEYQKNVSAFLPIPPSIKRQEDSVDIQ